MTMSLYFLVAIGSGVGGAARYWLSGVVGRRFELFPWGTLVVNISGSFVIGLFFGATGSGLLFTNAPASHQLFTYGLLGGFTTYSTFSLETLNLVREGESRRAAAYVAGSFATCLAAVALGYVLGILII